MIKKLLWLIFIFYLPVSAQVSSIPQYSTEYDSIKIIFDASKGGRGMMGYTGTLYTHTGVLTNLSGGQWAHVIGSWGNNSLQPSLTRIGTDLYELVIGYPRQFYKVTNSSEHIQKLAFVFRSSDARQQTEDLFLEIFSSGISIVINNPAVSVSFGDPLRSPGFANPDDTVEVNVTAVTIQTMISSLKFYIDGNLKSQTNQNNLTYDFISNEYSSGAHSAVVIAADTGNLADTVNFIMYVNPPVTDAVPPSGTIPGINIAPNYDVTFVLFAPYKEFVYLIGSFNDWKVNTNYFLKRHYINEDSVLWHLTLNAMTPGSEKLFQYLVDGTIRIADPYSEKVLDPWNDQQIPGTTYPGLIPYPSGKTDFPVSVFATGVQPYQWQVTNFQKPKKTDLVIYELLIRDFLSAHDFKTLKDTLMYLKNLGVNAIELMPVNEFEGNESWGYNPSFYFAPDKYYGPKDELKKLIDRAHELGIAVIIDIVLNHSYGQSPLVRLYWDKQYNRPAENNPWYNTVSPNPVFSWGYDFNHESIHTKNFVDRVNKYWIEEFKADGFRFDFTKGFTNTPGDGSAYDAARINILKRMADRIWQTDSASFVILEHFAENSEEIVLSNYGMMLWGNMNHQYNEATMGYNSDLSGTIYKARGWQYPHLVSYMESHDEERLMYKNILYGNSSGSYDIKDIRTAINRIKLAAAFFFTVPGPKMIWQFEELGYDYSIDYDCRVCNKPIRWDYFSDPKRSNLYKVFAALIKLRTEYDAFESNEFTYSLNDTTKRITITGSGMDAVIIGNFGVKQKSVSPWFTHSGTWYDFFSGDSITVGDPFAQRMLDPGEFHIYTTLRIPPPEPGILLEADDPDDTQIKSFFLDQNYPNPFNPETVITYHLPVKSYVTLKVYDTLGREVTTLVAKEQNAGKYSVNFNASELTSGTYFYRLQSDTYNIVKKMILVK